MKRIRSLAARAKALISRKRQERELEEEVRCHLEMLAEENERRGMSPKEARLAARREFGGVEQMKEVYREARSFAWIESLGQDLRYAWRMMRHKPGVTAMVTLALALGIGANTSVFSVLNTLFLRPLSYPGVERLVWVGEVQLKQDQPGATGPVSYRNFASWQEQQAVFERMAAVEPESLSLKGNGDPERVRGDRVTASFFELLGVAPKQGRGFTVADFAADAEPVMVIGDRLWQTAFGGEADIVGRKVRVEGRPTTIVGVMPPQFRAALAEGGSRFWIPMVPPRDSAQLDARTMTVLAQLKPGMSLESARAGMRTVARRLEETDPKLNAGWGVRVEGLQEQSSRGASSALGRLLVIAAGLLLLIACANVANILLARGVERQKEIALRVAMGASRLRVVRQLMLENVLYALSGGAAGLVMAFWVVSALSRFGAVLLQDTGLVQFDIDGRVLGYAVLASAATALIFGVWPAIRGSRVDLNSALKEGGSGQAPAAAKRRFSSVLVVAQLTLSLMLLISAAFVLKSIYALWRLDWGFPTDQRLAMNLTLPSNRYGTEEQRAQFYRDFVAAVQALPGVKSAAMASSLPVELAAEPARAGVAGITDPLPASYRSISPDYLAALSIPLKQGRSFLEADSAKAAPVAIVNERLAQKVKLGETLEINGVRRTVVGIAADVVNQGILRKPGYEVLVPAAQAAPQAMSLIVYTSGDAAQFAAPVRQALARLDTDQAVYGVRTLEAAHAELCRPLEFVLLLLGIFAVVAVALAAVGVYGLTAHTVVTRTREIGIRMAMGAGAGRVLGEIVGRGLKLTMLGIALGGAAAFVSVRVLLTQIWWLGPTGPMVVALVAATLSLAALLACYIPARRATRIDPASALRAE